MSLNAATMPAGAVLDVLYAGWQAQSAGGLTASWMLHGRPGVGKSQVVQQLADRIGARLFDLRLTTIEPQDLRGLPYYDHEARRTVWYRPEDLPDDPATPSILFLDELTAASPYLQPTVYGLLQERRVGRHVLPDAVFIVAAGNTVEDGAIAYEMGTALSDRLVHLHMVAEANDWIENYAVPKGLSPAVAAFLRGRPDLLDTTEEALQQGQMIACTPRAWERTSQIMQAISDRSTRQAMIAGTLGVAAAAEFSAVADDIAASVHVGEMIEADATARLALYPQSLHGLNALVFGLVGAADKDTMPAVIEVMETLRHLAEKRPEPVFAALPLAELCAFGFEMLMAKALKQDLVAAFAASPAYAAYAADRQAAGLS
ncbi:AAA family ATPase [Cognatishimia sp. F0-27]|uniref:AAA family ATPase n=1 Tax=Cognatishimia sp. F0-27 TaxID=2816855 RepID=UPI001D0CD12A|nr:MoxR family ATPase [Cognatishimia sp. F0-27]MCC1493740.1 AAA family ATPase [Cognatishimia sp. F0-27]